MGDFMEENFCYNDNGFSRCSKNEKRQDQRSCKFYEKSHFRDECMYLRYAEYCDNIDAQKNAKKHK